MIREEKRQDTETETSIEIRRMVVEPDHLKPPGQFEDHFFSHSFNSSLNVYDDIFFQGENVIVTTHPPLGRLAHA